ncbi:MAG: hypothetical protein ACYS8W_00785 [Planctomycetota bacterium]|jgi:hypothetical protein
MVKEPENNSEEKDRTQNAPAEEKSTDADNEKPEAADAAPESEEKISRSVVNNIYREMKRWKEKCRQAEARANSEKKKRRETEAEADKVRGIVRRARINDALKASANNHGAIDCAQVAEFLNGSVALDENLEPVVVDENGSPRANGSKPLTLDSLVHEFLSKYPHHVKPADAAGAGSEGSSGSPADMITRIRAAKTESELKKILAEK